MLHLLSIEGITYVYWASLYMHLFSAVAWLGGILFLTGVSRPIFEFYKGSQYQLQQELKERFLGFSWMLAITTAVTGTIIILWSTRFLFFNFSSLWLVLAHLKILGFLLLAGATFILRSSYRELRSARAETIEGEDLSPREIILWRVRVIEQIEVWLAILILLTVSLMQIN
ncbi:MAG: hypothetical protein JSS75_10535 [Bacteroidetes bacterium]|nr:hypothetical protein [Bacteroidota bacterium]